jgi:glutamine synthetase
VRFSPNTYKVRFRGRLVELPWNTDTEYEMGNMGHRPRTKGGYFPVNPVDSAQDIRSEMLTVDGEMGVKVEKHHHEVALPARARHEVRHADLQAADDMQKYKYVIHNVAHAYGKSATFMPKPVLATTAPACTCTSRSGRTASRSLPATSMPDLSRDLPVLHRRHHEARQGAERLHQPVDELLQASGPGLRGTGSARLFGAQPLGVLPYPVHESAEGKRVEVRFPDPTANPYLAFSAMLMAGLDGIKNKIHPGDAMDKDLYDLPPEELADIPTVCGSLREALEAAARRSTSS